MGVTTIASNKHVSGRREQGWAGGGGDVGEDHQVHGGGEEDRSQYEGGGYPVGEKKGDADYRRAGGHQGYLAGQCEGQLVPQTVVCAGQRGGGVNRSKCPVFRS